MPAQTKHHICFSQTHAMTSLTAFVSLLLLTTVVSTASAQGKEKHDYIYACVFSIFALYATDGKLYLMCDHSINDDVAVAVSDIYLSCVSL